MKKHTLCSSPILNATKVQSKCFDRLPLCLSVVFCVFTTRLIFQRKCYIVKSFQSPKYMTSRQTQTSQGKSTKRKSTWFMICSRSDKQLPDSSSCKTSLRAFTKQVFSYSVYTEQWTWMRYLEFWRVFKVDWTFSKPQMFTIWSRLDMENNIAVH